ncbi:hypothetical protein GCM10022278_22880 [Allohahella marinimesophila]|uniref:Uncharacterized protein n=1 Tax=Allohahella marinimesophila TaxID=1054972 RepID=A0ABP7PF15_9GAMM
MVNTTGIKRVGQRLQNMLLTDHFPEFSRPPFSSQGDMRHWVSVSPWECLTLRLEAGPASHTPAPESTAVAAPFRA